MGYERYPRGTNPQGDYYGRNDPQDYGRDYGSGRDYSYSSARDYRAAGNYGDDDRGQDRQPYGARDYGNQRYAQRDQQRGDYGRGGGRDGNQSDNRYGERSRYGADADRYRGAEREYHGSYGAGGRRFEDFGPYAHADDDNYRGNTAYQRQSYDRGNADRGRQQGYGRQPQGYDYEERGFFARAGDEVRSWFGDEDAERRREYDSRMDERAYGARDDDYHSWRQDQIRSLDRDYDEYRRENRSKFDNEFGAWRTGRQGQRDALKKVEEHMDVVGSDGEHVGTVDKVRGDRILLTKNDADAGGRHHSIPSSWLQTVDSKVTLRKSAAEAKSAWRDEERNQALFGDDSDGTTRRTQTGQTDVSGQSTTGTTGSTGDKALGRSFSGTY